MSFLIGEYMKRVFFIFLSALIPLTINLNANSATSTSNTNQIKVEGRELVTTGRILFDTNLDTIKSESITYLYQIRDYMVKNKSVTLLRIEGHVVDSDNAKSQDLSSRRALSVAKWLTDNGIDCKRLIAVGFGDSKPVQTDDTTTSEASSEVNYNNRIVFSLASLRGRLISGLPADGGGIAIDNLCERVKR